MSWLFAISRKCDDTTTEESYPHGTPLGIISTPHLYIAIGGNPDTAIREHNTETSTGWAVVGTGIRRSNSGASILTRDEWGHILAQESFDADYIDGHFVALRWKDDRIECFTDQLGQRTVYYASYYGGICISTRIDWVARTTDHSELDFASLGGRWLLFNQLRYDSCIAGIERLGPGGQAAFSNGRLNNSLPFIPWLPSFEPGTADTAMNIVQQFAQCGLKHHHSPTLGLSGGLDSRFLLALLISNPDHDLATHTFGAPNDPDVQIAQQIAATLGLPNYHLNDPLPDVQTCIDGIRSFVSQTLLIEPATSWLKLRYYVKLRDYRRLMIDGGFGEIARRQYLNRVVRLGGAAVRTRDTTRLMQLMRAPRADIFSPEVTALLESGTRSSLESAIVAMPPVEKIGIEDFADLLAVRTRVPNYGAPEQARLDGEILNFMPLVQPSFLRAVFGIPAKQRSNAGLYYNIIRGSNPALSRFPLAKSGFAYRFGLSSNAIWLLLRLKSKLAKPYSDSMPDQLLAHLREYVIDIAHSKSVAENPAYDYRKIVDAVTRYYAGELHLRSTVDWWLTFELWRRSLVNKTAGH
jgi:hypothetical protein